MTGYITDNYVYNMNDYSAMKKILFFCFFLFLCFSMGFISGQAQKFKPFVSVAAYSNEGEPYLEFTFVFKGNTLVYQKNHTGNYGATVSVIAKIYSEDKLFKTKEFSFSTFGFGNNSPEGKPDLLRLEEVAIPNNQYNIQFTIYDINSSATPYNYSVNANVNFSENKPTMSGISFYSSFNQVPNNYRLEKYEGYYFIPLFNNEVTATVSTLAYSFEIYNTDIVFGAGKSVALRTLIENLEDKSLAIPSLQKEITLQAKPMILYIDEMDISLLPAGKYYFTAQIMDKDNTILKEQRKIFTNKNP
jgi:hypothetical protein